MPDFGSPIAQNVKSPLETLSSIMGIKQQQQALQSGALGIQQQQQNLQGGAADVQMKQQSASQRQGIAGVDWGKYADDTGAISTDKMLGDKSLQQASGDQFLDVVKAGAGIRQQQLQNKTSLVGLNDNLRNQFGTMIGSLRTDPDVIADNPAGRQKVKSAMDQFAQAGGPDAARVAQIYGPVAEHAPQGKLVGGISNIQLAAMDAARQAGAQAPGFTDTGAGLQQTNPQGAGGNLGSPPAQPALGGAPGLAKGLPPTTPVMRNGKPGYAGDSTVQAGPAIGEVAGTEGPVAANNAHFAQVQQDAAPAQNRIASLQTIKEQLPAALTGGGDWRRKILTQLSGVFGLGNDAQTANDVMAKNLAVLASQGGNTDAARSLGEMANPSYHMTRDAAAKAADQLMGIEAKKQAAGSFFSGTPTNSPQYAQKMTQWNQNADPRAFEYAAKAPADQAKMKAEMVAAGTWTGLAAKMRALHGMGVEPQ